MGTFLRRAATAVAFWGVVASATGASGRAAPAPPPALRYREDYREHGNREPTGRFHCVTRVPGIPTGGPVTFDIGTLSVAIPAGTGRVRIRTESLAAVARVRRRGSSTEVLVAGTSRTAEASPLGDRYVWYDEEPIQALERAALGIGDARWDFAVAVAGYTESSVDGHPFADPWSVSLRAAGFVPASGEGAPVLVLCPGPRDGSWTGRAAGVVLGAGDAPAVTRSLDGAPPVEVALEGTADLGAGGGPAGVTAASFDVAVCAAPGAHVVSFAAADGIGGSAAVSVPFEAPRAVPATALSSRAAILEIREDGHAWAWGQNLFGEVGDGTVRQPFSPVPVPGPANVRSVAAGDEFSMALDGRGRVWYWGVRERAGTFPDFGGWLAFDPFPTPVPEALPLPAVQISAGYEHAAALLEDGTVRTWGWSVPKVMKDGTTRTRVGFLPDPPAVDQVVAIACGDSHVLALRADGTVWTWNAPVYGAGPSTTVARVEGLPAIRAVAAGYGWSIALDGKGGVWTWGGNEKGQLADGTTTDRATPARVEGLPAIAQVAAADDNALVVDGEGGIWAWGGNDSGQLGDGTEEERHLPRRVPDLGPAVTVATGWWVSVAVLADGSVWIWGLDPGVSGPVGDGGVRPRLYPRGLVPGNFPVMVGSATPYAARPRRRAAR